MQLDAILEVAIGLVFVWLVISVATMEIQNRIGEKLGWRASHLEKSILSMLKEKDLVDRFYAHPLLKELEIKDKNGNVVVDKKGIPLRPNYIPNPIFATAAFEVIINAGKGKKDATLETMSIPEMTKNFQAMVEKNNVLPYVFPNMAKTMQGLKKDTDKFDHQIEEYRKNVEGWFDNVMSQSSSWYKIRAQWMAFWIGLSIAVIMNIDSIQVAQKLWQEPSTRAVLVAQAQAEAQKETPSDALKTAQSLNFPVGWVTKASTTELCKPENKAERSQTIFYWGSDCKILLGAGTTKDNALEFAGSLIIKVFGFLLSAFAAAQGAPFWFDILRKLVGVKQQTAPATKE